MEKLINGIRKDFKVIVISLFIISIYPLIIVYTRNFLKANSSLEDKIKTMIIPTPTSNQNVIDTKAEENKSDEQSKIAGVTTRKFSLGVSLTDYKSESGIKSLENISGVNFSTISIYKQFGNEFNDKFVQEDLKFIKESGKTLLLAWEPWDPARGTQQERDYLAEIINGSLDSYVTTFANEIKTYGAPVVIRFGHEMNGNWYPWGGRPAEYTDAYRRIVNIFRELGVYNAKFMWSINADSVPYEPINSLAKYYPGDGYVDYVGIDGFNFGAGEWRSFRDIFAPAYIYLTQTYKKPIIISETASSEIGGSKENWISDMFTTLQNEFTNIQEVIWFSILKESDWRIDSTDSSIDSFNKLKYR